MTRIVPVILAGGGGSRLWPISTPAAPKQLLALVSGRTLLQETALRVSPAVEPRFLDPVIVTGAALGDETARQLAEAGVRPGTIVLEPKGRNTAPAIAVAARVVAGRHPGALMAVLASDHHIGLPDAFRAAIFDGAPAAEAGALVTLGIVPTRAETGYGYIQRGDGEPPCFAAKRFVEKPDRATAEAYLEAGGYYWNASIFLFSPEALARTLGDHAPEIDAAAERALGEAGIDGVFLRLGPAFLTAPSISIDYAVMEKAADVRVVPVQMGWSDVGSMASLHEAGPLDGAGNAVRGVVLTEDVAGCYLRADDGVIAAIGVRDLVVVKSGEAVLVSALDRSQDVRAIHDRIRRLREPAAAPAPDLVDMLAHARRLRDWLVGEALPLWCETGWDGERGGFHERFALDGRPKLDDTCKRLRVQARQIFVCCTAHELGLPGPALERARDGFAFLVEHGWQEAGGWPHLFTPEGAVLEPMRDAYDHAFVLFAMAALYRATGETRALRWADRTMAYLDAAMADDVHDGFLESAPPVLPRRANPHMHLLEAFLALFDATADFRWLNRAGEMVRLLRTRFLDRETMTLREFFDAAWAPAAGLEGRIREPGHHWEWAFLLSEYERRAGADLGPEIEALAGFALTHGHSPVTGLAFDEVLEDGAVHKPTHRIWPQTEALRGLAMLRRRGRAGLEERIEGVAAALSRHFLEPAGPGIWIDEVAADGAPRAEAVPASSLYHLVTGILALGGGD